MDTTLYLEPAHQHAAGCWWNHDQAGWACPTVSRTSPSPDPSGDGPVAARARSGIGERLELASRAGHG